MNNNLRFILKTTGIHILTYILCGVIFCTCLIIIAYLPWME